MSHATFSNHSDLSINGITIDVSGDITFTDLVNGLNDGLRGKVDITASIDSSTGKLALESKTGVSM